jgi:trigger factor
LFFYGAAFKGKIPCAESCALGAFRNLVDKTLKKCYSKPDSDTVTGGKNMAEKENYGLPALPEAALGKYKGLAAECQVQPVTPAQITLALDTLRMRAAESCPVDGPAARGDDVVLDFAGFAPDGTPIPDSTMQNVSVHLGRGQMLPGVEDRICGHHAGETFEIAFTYPKDFRMEQLSGSSATFRITLHAVMRRIRPAADDAFAKSQSCENMEALRGRIAEEKRAMHERMAKRAVRTALLEQAGANLIVTFPPALLDSLAERKMQRLAAEVAARGSTLEAYFRLTHQQQETVRAEMRSDAEKGLRRRLAVEKIAQAEQIDVSGKEIEAEYARLAEQENADADSLRSTLTENTVRGALLTEKVCDFLVRHAAIRCTEKAKEG